MMNGLLNFCYINSQKPCPLFCQPRSHAAAQIQIAEILFINEPAYEICKPVAF